MAPPSTDIHLVLLIHGLWGSPAHLAVAEEELARAWATSQDALKTSSVSGNSEDPVVTTEVAGSEDDLVIVVAGGMTSQLTYDGIDVCASRVAWELDRKIEEIEHQGRKVVKFSLLGYSLGGLVARYLCGLLHTRNPSFFELHKPMTFSTIATPHLGIPRYNTFLSTVLTWVGSKLLSRSGEQLYVSDKYSEQDPRPLLEIMADPKAVFYQALERFSRLQIYANGVNDHTVPYPSAAIEIVDHFAEWEEQGLEVEADEADIVQTWRHRPAEPDTTGKKKRTWQKSIGSLPPVLRYRFPYNYVILVLFPIMLPLVIILMAARLSLDTRRSARRLQQLAQSGPDQTSFAIPSAHGLSIQGLRDTIRRVERGIESEMIESADAPFESPLVPPEVPFEYREATVQVRMKDSQLRMAMWLNSLPLQKYITWYPEVANSHAVAIVRDPSKFPAHERGRGLLKLWARKVAAAA